MSLLLFLFLVCFAIIVAVLIRDARAERNAPAVDTGRAAFLDATADPALAPVKLDKAEAAPLAVLLGAELP